MVALQTIANDLSESLFFNFYLFMLIDLGLDATAIWQT